MKGPLSTAIHYQALLDSRLPNLKIPLLSSKDFQSISASWVTRSKCHFPNPFAAADFLHKLINPDLKQLH